VKGFPSNDGVKEGYPPKKTLFCRYWLLYRVGQKNWHSFYMLITLSNRNQFSKVFHCRNQKKICSNTVTKDLITLHMSLHYFVKYQTSHLSWWRHWPIAWSTLIEPIYSDLNPVDYAVWGVLQQMVYQRRQFTTINQLKQTIVTEWGKLAAFGWSRHCSVASPAWVHHPQGGHIEQLWWENCEMWQLL